MIVFNLKSEWYDKINSGIKSHEYREVKPYWIKRIEKFIKLELNNKASGFPYVEFRKGYPNLSDPKAEFFIVKVKSITIINGLDTDLKIDKPVYDIELDLSKKYIKDGELMIIKWLKQILFPKTLKDLYIETLEETITQSRAQLKEKQDYIFKLIEQKQANK